MFGQAIPDDKKQKIVEGIYDRYYRYMTMCAMDILKNKRTAQEAVQKAFYHIAATYELFEDGSAKSTAALVYIYVKCAAMHSLNPNKRNTKVVTFSDYTSRVAKNIATEEADTESLVLDEETIVTVSEALDKLDDAYRDLIVLKYFYHVRNADIATVLQVNSTTVKNRVSHAKQVLKERLGFAKDEQIDALLTVSIGRTVARYAEVFMSFDVSKTVVDLRIKNRILKRVNNRSRRLWRAIRIAAVACMLLLSLAFTVCMCIPNVRNAVWNALTVDDPVQTPITSSDNESTNTSNKENAETVPDTSANEAPITPPQSIEKIAKATYLPDGYYYEEMEPTSFQVSIVYYDTSGNVKFVLSQRLITADGEGSWADNEEASVTKVKIHSFEGLLFEYVDVPDNFTLVWQDASYMYMLAGEFASETELLKIAEGIQIE